MKGKNRKNAAKEVSDDASFYPVTRGNGATEEEVFDRSSAFVHMAVKNRADIPSTTTTVSSLVTTSSTVSGSNCDSLPTYVIEAQKMAADGNYMFALKQYRKAIDLYTEAIKLDPQEVRFFGNRAFCYEVLGDYEKALEDAETALAIQPSWIKGHFRRGSAFEQAGRFKEAECAFDRVLFYERDCPEASQAKQRVMARQLATLGFSLDQSHAAIIQYGSVELASKNLLATKLLCSSAMTEIFDSDDESELCNGGGSWSKSSSCSVSSAGTNAPTPPTSTVVCQPPSAKTATTVAVDPLLDPKNPLKWDTLWVGNLGSETTEDMLISMFNKFGKFRQCNMMLEKHCAFITYLDWKHAGDAMKEMQWFQGKNVLGQKILIKFPDRAMENAGKDSHKEREVKSGGSRSGVSRKTSAGSGQHSAHRGTLILRKNNGTGGNILRKSTTAMPKSK